MEPLDSKSAHDYIVKKIEAIKKMINLIRKTDHGSKSYSEYYRAFQLILELYMIRKIETNEAFFATESIAKLGKLKSRMLGSSTLNPVFHALFGVILCLKNLDDADGQRIFYQFKEERDRLLEQKNSLFNFLILVKKIETEDEYVNIEALYYAHKLFNLDPSEEDLFLELKKEVSLDDLKIYIKEYYASQDFILDEEIGGDVYFFKDGIKTEQVTMTFIPGNEKTNSVMFSIHE